MTLKSDQLSIVILGASGAVGTETLNTLLQLKIIQQLTLLGFEHIGFVKDNGYKKLG